jgi:alkaline phosphatase D
MISRHNKQQVLAFGIALTSPLLLVSCAAIAAAEALAVYSQSGDIGANEAVVWARCNNQIDSRLIIDFSTSRDFGDAYAGQSTAKEVRRKEERKVSADTDYTGSVVFRGLKPNQTYYYRACCVGRPDVAPASKLFGPVGQFTTAPDKHEAPPAKFVWVADLGGQGWGRNPDLTITDLDGNLIQGGYVIFDVISKLAPDFAIFAGDIIYADNPIPSQKTVPAELGGGTWINEPAKDFVAITLDEYRANWRYNLGDEKLQHFLLNTPLYIQWDDHEVTNNWYPGEILTDAPYNGIAANILAERSRQAFFEYNPIAGDTIHRKFRHGKHLELFLLDERSFRDPNPDNYDPSGIEMLGQQQFEWLKQSLKRSRATWKVISTHDPLSIVTGGVTDRDAWGQGDARVLGREVQLQELLKFINDAGIKNVVFITADVHFAAAISYDPARAQFGDFDSFWEFVIGPVHAGAFGANELDASFGPRFEYLRAPSTEGFTIQNLPPPNLHSFGTAEITANGKLIMRIHDISGAVLFEKTFAPE